MLGIAMLYRRRNCIILYVHCARKTSFVSGNLSFMELERARHRDADDLMVCSQIPYEISRSINITIPDLLSPLHDSLYLVTRRPLISS
jgi:hypothetical protein